MDGKEYEYCVEVTATGAPVATYPTTDKAGSVQQVKTAREFLKLRQSGGVIEVNRREVGEWESVCREEVSGKP